jgi:hypothetical protein
MGPHLRYAVILAGLALAAAPVQAQLSGHNLKGDFGLRSGTQPDPGFYVSPMFLSFDADTLRNRDGDSIGIDPERRAGLDARAYALVLSYVTDFTLLGAHVGFMAAPSFTNNNLEIPVLDFESRTDTGFADLYVQPFVLGWHAPRADVTVGLGVFAPTGRYEPGASDNVGLGMWSYEVFAGTTLYLDEEKSWSLATTAFYETHGKKKDTDVRVGDILTLEGGLGKSFLDGALSVGVAYYAQWKLADDDLGLRFELPGGPLLGKHRVYGFGPELTVPIASKTKLFALVNGRFFWETGARTTVEGTTLLITATVPIPSLAIN